MAGDDYLSGDYIGADPSHTSVGVQNPDAVNPEISLYTKAYGLASKAGDKAAMAELHELLTKKQQQVDSGLYNPSAGNTGAQNFIEGTGRGMSRVARGAGNLVHAPGAPSNEDLKESDQLDKSLLDTGGGALGDVAGQVAATAPLGMGSGALTRALGAVPRLAGTAGRVLTRALAAGGENALQSAVTGNPDDPTGEAEKGAAVGAGLSALGGVAGKALRGFVKKSEPAERLVQDAAEEGKDLFVPISQGGTGPMKTFYQKALPYALGAEGRLKGQATQARKVMEEVEAAHAMPDLVDESGKLKKTPPPIGNTMEQTAADIGKTYDKAYQDTVKGYAFKVPENYRERVLQRLEEHPELGNAEREQIAQVMDDSINLKAGKDGTINGAQLTDLLGKTRGKLEGLEKAHGIGNETSTNSAIGSLKDIVQDAIDEHTSMLPGLKGADAEQASSVIRDLQNYQRLGKSWGGAKALMDTAEANVAERGAIKHGRLAANAPPESTMRGIGQDVHEVLEQESPGGVNPAGRHFLHTLGTPALLTVGAATGHLPAAVAAIGAGNVMATKGFQKGLYGDTAMQQNLARLMRQNPQLAYSAGMAGREAVNAPGQ